MSRYILRGCPRCGGDLYVNYHDSKRYDWRRLQRGHHPVSRANPRRGKAGEPGRNDRFRKSLL